MKVVTKRKTVKIITYSIVSCYVFMILYTLLDSHHFQWRKLISNRGVGPVARVWDRGHTSPIEIPKILHLVLLGPNPPEHMNEMVKFNTDLAKKNKFQVMIWRDIDAESLIASQEFKFPGILQIWRHIKDEHTTREIPRIAEFLRALIMWSIGGVYLDTDVLSCGNLDFMIDSPGMVSFPLFSHKNMVETSAVSAPPNHRLFEMALEITIDIGPRITKLNHIKTAGPHLMALAVDTYFKEIGVELDPLYMGKEYSDPPFDAKPVEGVIEINKDGTKGNWAAQVADIRFRAEVSKFDMYHLGFKSWIPGKELAPVCFEHPELLTLYLEETCNEGLHHRIDGGFADCGNGFKGNENTNSTPTKEES